MSASPYRRARVVTHEHEETAVPVRVTVTLVQVFKERFGRLRPDSDGMEGVEPSLRVSETRSRPSLIPVRVVHPARIELALLEVRARCATATLRMRRPGRIRTDVSSGKSRAILPLIYEPISFRFGPVRFITSPFVPRLGIEPSQSKTSVLQTPLRSIARGVRCVSSLSRFPLPLADRPLEAVGVVLRPLPESSHALGAPQLVVAVVVARHRDPEMQKARSNSRPGGPRCAPRARLRWLALPHCRLRIGLRFRGGLGMRLEASDAHAAIAGDPKGPQRIEAQGGGGVHRRPHEGGTRRAGVQAEKCRRAKLRPMKFISYIVDWIRGSGHKCNACGRSNCTGCW